MKLVATLFYFSALLISLSVAASLIQANVDDEFELVIIHVNDFHARFEETNLGSGACTTPPEENACIGGYARLVTKVKELQEDHKDSNVVYLNAGDNFQGTLWYNIGRWQVTSAFLNMLPADAVVRMVLFHLKVIENSKEQFILAFKALQFFS